MRKKTLALEIHAAPILYESNELFNSRLFFNSVDPRRECFTFSPRTKSKDTKVEDVCGVEIQAAAAAMMDESAIWEKVTIYSSQKTRSMRHPHGAAAAVF